MIKLGKNGNMMMTVPHLTASSMTSKSHMKNGCKTELWWISKEQNLLSMIATLKEFKIVPQSSFSKLKEKEKNTNPDKLR